MRWTAFGVGIIMLLYTFSERKDYHGYFNVKLDTGLREGINTSAEFYKGLKIQGPIFNNYDIGGYLIYHLYPQEKVFVDNRPEAYSVSFFEDIYYPMMADETKWKEMDAKYNFNCIYFDRNDNTEHGQPFLIRRIEDPEWVPIFADQRDPAIILLKRNQQNAAIIAQYELPKSMFTSRPN